MKYRAEVFSESTSSANLTDYLNHYEIPREDIVSISYGVDTESHRRFGEMDVDRILLVFMVPKDSMWWDYPQNLEDDE